jgi:hypothetical protein
MRQTHVSSFAIAALTTGVALATPAVWAQRPGQTTGVSTARPVQKISKTDNRMQTISKAPKHDPQSLRYLISDTP